MVFAIFVVFEPGNEKCVKGKQKDFLLFLFDYPTKKDRSFHVGLFDFRSWSSQGSDECDWQVS